MHPKAALLALHGFTACATVGAYDGEPQWYIQRVQLEYTRFAMFVDYRHGWVMVRPNYTPPDAPWGAIPGEALDMLSEELIEFLTC